MGKATKKGKEKLPVQPSSKPPTTTVETIYEENETQIDNGPAPELVFAKSPAPSESGWDGEQQGQQHGGWGDDSSAQAGWGQHPQSPHPNSPAANELHQQIETRPEILPVPMPQPPPGSIPPPSAPPPPGGPAAPPPPGNPPPSQHQQQHQHQHQQHQHQQQHQQQHRQQHHPQQQQQQHPGHHQPQYQHQASRGAGPKQVQFKGHDRRESVGWGGSEGWGGQQQTDQGWGGGGGQPQHPHQTWHAQGWDERAGWEQEEEAQSEDSWDWDPRQRRQQQQQQQQQAPPPPAAPPAWTGWVDEAKRMHGVPTGGQQQQQPQPRSRESVVREQQRHTLRNILGQQPPPQGRGGGAPPPAQRHPGQIPPPGQGHAPQNYWANHHPQAEQFYKEQQKRLHAEQLQRLQRQQGGDGGGWGGDAPSEKGGGKKKKKKGGKKHQQHQQQQQQGWGGENAGEWGNEWGQEGGGGGDWGDGGDGGEWGEHDNDGGGWGGVDDGANDGWGSKEGGGGGGGGGGWGNNNDNGGWGNNDGDGGWGNNDGGGGWGNAKQNDTGWGGGGREWGNDQHDDGWDALSHESYGGGKGDSQMQFKQPTQAAYATFSPGASGYKMPSRTMAHAYAGTIGSSNPAFTPPPGGPNPMNEYANVSFLESKRAGFAGVQKAFWGKTRLARNRIHWMFPPDKDERVAALLQWIEKMSYSLGMFGLHKFLQSREKGALFVNADYRPIPTSADPAFDYLTFPELQGTMDKVLQESVAFCDPAIQTIVFVFLPSKSGNSVAIWRRKIKVPNNVRLMLMKEIALAYAGLRREEDYVVHVDEIPPSPGKPRAMSILPAKGRLNKNKSLKNKGIKRKGLPGTPMEERGFVKKKRRKWWNPFSW